MTKKLTIQDIARLAEVSHSTVSRVLNKKPDGDAATRERVLHVMEEQGFVPNLAATRLAGGRSQIVGILAPPLFWPYIADIAQGEIGSMNRYPSSSIRHLSGWCDMLATRCDLRGCSRQARKRVMQRSKTL